MTNRKGQNSILFIATLGVYLGLVLAGGTAPQVYAHAATTRAFDAREEIEIVDDLTGPPDDERATLGQSVQVYIDDVEQLILALKRLHDGGTFDQSADFFEVRQNSQLPCVPANTAGSYSPEQFVNVNDKARPFLERFSKQLTYGYSLGDCVANRSFADKSSTDSRAVFKLDKSGLSVEVVVRKESPQAAALLSGDLASVFHTFTAKEKLPVRKAISENTTFRTENDQVTVVTRLARASLDELLSSDAK